MKTHHLIFLTTCIFAILFYDQDTGLNLGIFGMAVSILVFFQTDKKKHDKKFFILFLTSILSSIAFAYYGDFASFIALSSSLLLFRLKSKDSHLKSIFVIPLAIINFFAFIFRVFRFNEWLPVGEEKRSGTAKKLVAFVLIPILLLGVFFIIYSLGSSHFNQIITGYEFDIDFVHLIVIISLGFFLAFSYWNYWVVDLIHKNNTLLDNEFPTTQKAIVPTYRFFDVKTERISGIISLIGLNILLIIFIGVFNYEQFFEHAVNPKDLSDDTHERVVAVILSIIMAIVLILHFFKGSFNFDKDARSLKILAKIWIVLNAILVISAVVKNTEYINNLGLTYKRLGVYAFLILSIIGLLITFIKIQKRKTNAFIFNQMFWYFYGTVLVCSYFNWGRIITKENIDRNNFNLEYHKHSVDFNEDLLLDYCRQRKLNTEFQSIEDYISNKTSEKFLSKVLFYETIQSARQP